MGVETVIGVAGLGLSAFGTVKQMSAQKKAVAAQKKSIAAQNRQQKLEQMMERRRQARAARAAIASSVNAAAQQGAGESTVTQGTVGALQSQLSGNLSFLNQSEFLIDAANKARMAQAGFESKAATYGGISSLGLSVFSNAGAIADLRNIGNKPQPVIKK